MPSQIIDLLDLAKKYGVDGVKPFVSHFLERDWPPTLVEWLRQQTEFVRLKDLWLAESDVLGELTLDDMCPDPATAIRIGQAYNIPSILSAAFYCISEIDIDDDWDRWHLEGSDWKFSGGGDLTPTDPTKNWRRTARWSQLDKQSLLQVFHGRKALQARKKVLSRVYNFEQALDGSKPQEGCQAELERLSGSYVIGDGNPEPLQTLMKMLKANRTNKWLCRACRNTVGWNIDNEMQKLWDDLPHIFSFAEPVVCAYTLNVLTVVSLAC